MSRKTWPTIEYITQLAKAFRKAFDDYDLSHSPGFLPNFPSGCCSWASLFIGHYLKSEFSLSPKRIISARHTNGGQHEWLMLNDVIIDITADQFDDAPSPVIVETSSEWHARFQGGEIIDLRPVSDYDNEMIYLDKQKPSDVYGMIVTKVREILNADGWQPLSEYS